MTDQRMNPDLIHDVLDVLDRHGIPTTCASTRCGPDGLPGRRAAVAADHRGDLARAYRRAQRAPGRLARRAGLGSTQFR